MFFITYGAIRRITLVCVMDKTYKMGTTTSSSSIQKVSRIWKIIPQLDQGDEVQVKFRSAMNQPNTTWVIMKRDLQARNKSDVFVDGKLVFTFRDGAIVNDEIVRSGVFDLGGVLAEIHIWKNTSWTDSSWAFKYKLTIQSRKVSLYFKNFIER